MQKEKEKKDGKKEEKEKKKNDGMFSSLSLVEIYREPSHDVYPHYVESCWQACHITAWLKPALLGFHLGWSSGASIVPQLTSKIVCNLTLDLVVLGILVTFTIKSKSLCLYLY